MPPFHIPHGALLDGAKLCVENGLRLRWDAEVLFNSKAYLSAHVLAVFSSEEFGKSIFLSKKYYEGLGGVSEEEYEKIFTRHPAKISFFLEQTADILPNDKDRQETIEFFKGLGKEEHKRKMKSIYVDFDSGKWLLPIAMDKQESWAQALGAKKTASFMWYSAKQTLEGNFPKKTFGS